MKSLFLAVAASFFSLGAPAATSWTLIDLGTLGGPGSYGAAVNDGGQVVGCSDTASGGIHAFIYENGSMRDLEPASGSANSCALAVNTNGAAAGRSSTGELVVWSSGSVTRLGVQGDVGGINGAGVVVGTYKSGEANRAFVYRNGVFADLGELGSGAFSSAAAINERGQIAGTSNGRAFLHDGATMRDLGTLGGGSGNAKGINDRGEVVGMASTGHAQPAPFIYDGVMRELPGPSYSAAIAINNRGQVVGSGEGIYGYLIENGQLTRLDTISAVAAKGWRHLEPTGINNRGWIVGTGFNANGDTRAFLLVPGEAVRNAQARNGGKFFRRPPR